MRTRASVVASLVLPGFLALCAGAPAARAGAPPVAEQKRPTGVLRITGSSTMCPLVEAIGERFRGVHPGVGVDVQCGGSDRGIRDLLQGHADIAMLSRALKAEEKDLFGFPMARDGVSIIVHATNPLVSLSHAQVADVFSGKIGSWRSLGGKDAPITVILREKGKPVTELFEKHFGLPGKLAGRVVPGDNPVTIAAVAARPDAIAYVSSGEAARTAGAGVSIRLVAVDGVLPTERNVITGNYPITRSLSLVTRGLPAGIAKEFVNYCLSSKVVDLVERFDFVPYED